MLHAATACVPLLCRPLRRSVAMGAGGNAAAAELRPRFPKFQGQVVRWLVSRKHARTAMTSLREFIPCCVFSKLEELSPAIGGYCRTAEGLRKRGLPE